MAVWRYRIGSDPWKNLITEECGVVQGLDGLTVSSRVSECFARCQDPLTGSVAFCCRLLVKGEEPAAWSYAVFQAGRLFLVGVPSGIRDSFSRIVLQGGAGPPPCHVVLLSWQEQHIGGLLELIEVADAKKLTIWTSAWIWEEVLCHFGQRSPRLLELRHRTPLDVEAQLENEEHPNLTGAVVACERQMDLSLGLGVRLGLDYVPSKSPALRVSFQCNHLRILIDPLNAVRDEQTALGLRNGLEKAIRPFRALRNEFLIRYGDLPMQSSLPPPDTGFWQRPKPQAVWEFEDVVDLTSVGKSPQEIQFSSTPPTPVNSSISNGLPIASCDEAAQVSREETHALLNRTAVMILCGGLAAKRKRDLIDPGRRLGIGSRGESILVWRLSQLARWAGGYSVRLPVLLMTSPDTEQIVQEELTQFQALRLSGDNLEVTLLPQLLVPVMAEELRPTELPDGGWTLGVRGHLDFLFLLDRWRKATGRGRDIVFVCAHNNLGCLFDRRTVATLLAFERHKALLGVELFQFQRDPDENELDARWDLMSYAAGDLGALRLFKDAAYPPAEPLPPCRWYSSQTWYVNLRQLPNLPESGKLGQALFNPPVSERPHGPWQLTRDAEQASHDGTLSVCGLVERQPAAPRGLYSYPRFLVVRTEDHLRESRFSEAFHEALDAFENSCPPAPGGAGSAGAATPSDEGGSSPFLETVPAEMRYVWGGHLISVLKGRPVRHIAETWEISTHPAGPSAVYRNVRHVVPLPELLRQARRGGRAGHHLDYMAKYLDCHSPLSIQVHPDDVTAQFLFPKKGFHVTDPSGKEESFFVLRAASHGGFHLFLGLERDSLAPIAQRLLPILRDYVDQDPAKLPACYLKLVKELREALLQWADVAAVAEPLQVKPEFLLASVQPSSPEEIEAAKLGALRGRLYPLEAVFAYHVEGPSDSAPRPSPLNLLDKEYVFAAIGVIRLIEAAALRVCDGQRDHRPDLVEAARPLFDHRMQPGGDPRRSPLLRYFHPQEVKEGDWGRVPPGTVHSWQGGGNFLVELAQRSDNTFRILDFGRELTPATWRQMHYTEAMFALTADSILSRESANRLIFQAERESGHANRPRRHSRMCHSALDYRLFVSRDADPPRREAVPPGDAAQAPQPREGGADSPSADGEWSSPCDAPAEWSVLMNPDDVAHIRTDATEPGQPLSEVSVGRCRALLIAPGTRFRVLPAQRDNRLLYVFPRVADEDLLCVSLGDTKLEVALWRHRESPSVVWRQGQLPSRKDKLPQVRLRDVLEEVASLVRFLTPGEERTRVRVAISWPGPVDGETLYSSVLGAVRQEELRQLWAEAGGPGGDRLVVLNDAFAGARGEHHHPLGGLARGDSGMVLNVGSGICAGFYHPGPVDRDEARRAAACGAVGRWLFIDPYTGRVEPRPANGDIAPAVFRDQVDLRDGRWIRATTYLSSRGIALRFLSRWSHAVGESAAEVQPFLTALGIDGATWNTIRTESLQLPEGELVAERFVRGCEALRQEPRGFQAHKVLLEINQRAAAVDRARRRVAEQIIIEVAEELAQVVEQTRAQLNRSDCTSYRACANQVVLTGSVGKRFGRVGAEDLLVDVMQQCLDRSCSVKRSEISISSVREVHGFLQHEEAMGGR